MSEEILLSDGSNSDLNWSSVASSFQEERAISLCFYVHEAGTNMLLINKGQAKREPFKGIGGVQPKKIDFVHFDIC